MYKNARTMPRSSQGFGNNEYDLRGFIKAPPSIQLPRVKSENDCVCRRPSMMAIRSVIFQMAVIFNFGLLANRTPVMKMKFHNAEETKRFTFPADSSPTPTPTLADMFPNNGTMASVDRRPHRQSKKRKMRKH